MCSKLERTLSNYENATELVSFGSHIVITVPVINAASLSWNLSKIAKDNGIVVLAEETAKPRKPG